MKTKWITIFCCGKQDDICINPNHIVGFYEGADSPEALTTLSLTNGGVIDTVGTVAEIKTILKEAGVEGFITFDG